MGTITEVEVHPNMVEITRRSGDRSSVHVIRLSWAEVVGCASALRTHLFSAMPPEIPEVSP